MASRQFNGASAMGTAVAPTQEGMWSYAVHAQDEDDAGSTTYNSLPTRTRPAYTTTNNLARPKTRSKSKSMQGLDIAYAAGPGFRRDDGSVNGDVDSLQDSFKPRPVAKDRPRVKRKGSLGAVSTLSNGVNDDPDKWIHRDKLQQIEIREMMEQGRRVDLPSSRAASRAGRAASQASSVDLDARADEDQYGPADKKRQRTFSPTLSSENLREDGQNARVDYQDENQPSPAHNRRPSISRIPVTKASPVAEELPPFRPEQMTRARSGSQSSQNMLDFKGYSSQDYSADATSPQSSPPKVRQTKTSLRGRGARGGRGGTARPQTATSPTNGTPSRPGTSSGPRGPLDRPQDDPPWLENMYKPDPRLPQDQQMLPTHAKRLAQQQQQSGYDQAQPRKQPPLVFLEDDSGNEDTLHTSPPSSPRPSHAAQIETSPAKSQLSSHRDATSSKRNSYRADDEDASNPHHNTQWPLRSLVLNKYNTDQVPAHSQPSSPLSETGSWRHRTASENGSYSLVPTIQKAHEQENRSSPPHAQNPRATSNTSSPRPRQVAKAPSTTADADKEQPVRLPLEPEDDQVKKKGCGCCLVM